MSSEEGADRPWGEPRKDAAVLTAERARDDLAAQLAARYAAELRTLSDTLGHMMWGLADIR